MSPMPQTTFQAETPLRALLDTLVDGAIIIDTQGLVQTMNPACKAIFGYDPADVIGRNVSMLMPAPYHAEHDGYLDSYVRTGEKKIIGIGREVEGRRRCGEIFPMDLAVGEMQVEGRRLFVGVIRDLTERKAQQQEFDALQARHFHLSRVAAMNEMGTAIAHEINQPLAATANYVETARILLSRPEIDGEKVSGILTRALEQNNRASEIIARMRNFIERGDVAAEALPLGEVIDAAIMLGMAKFKDVRVDLTMEAANGVAPISVMGDPVQVQQVLVNLIRNGCEAMEGVDEQILSVDVALDPESPGFARISIGDTGTGLKPDVMADLFTAFTSSKPNGLGVGLSISRSIVRAHGGRIWAANRDDGDGAVFTFTLPLADSLEPAS